MPARTPYTPTGAAAPPLHRERVLDAAQTVAERVGSERLSMRLVAGELAVSPMALYRHVSNKDDLLDGLVQRLLEEVVLPDRSRPWDERLRALAHEIRALARRRPALFGLLLHRRAVGPQATRARDAAIAALIDAGLDDAAAARMERLLSTMVFGFSLSEATGRFAGVDVDAEFEAAVDLLTRAVVA